MWKAFKAVLSCVVLSLQTALRQLEGFEGPEGRVSVVCVRASIPENAPELMPDSDYAFEAVDCAGTQTENRKSIKDDVPQGRFALGRQKLRLCWLATLQMCVAIIRRQHWHWAGELVGLRAIAHQNDCDDRLFETGLGIYIACLALSGFLERCASSCCRQYTSCP